MDTNLSSLFGGEAAKKNRGVWGDYVPPAGVRGRSPRGDTGQRPQQSAGSYLGKHAILGMPCLTLIKRGEVVDITRRNKNLRIFDMM